MKKSDVLKWLDDHEFVFTEMTDSQKLEMRKELGICGAATSSSKYTQPCSFTPMENGRCRSHGGLTPAGIASPHWKTGKHSRYIPEGLRDRYNEAVSDPDLLEMRGEIALLDARLSELLEQLNTGGGMEDWGRILRLWEQFNDLQNQASVAGIDEAVLRRLQGQIADTMREMNRVIRGGHRNISLWHEIQNVMEDRRRLVSTEGKRLSDMHQMITAERATTWAYRILDIMKDRIKDKNVLGQIAADIRRLSL